MTNRLKEMRTQHNISQTALARAIGVTKRTIYSIEVENTDIRVSLAHKLAAYFGCAIEDIFINTDRVRDIANITETIQSVLRGYEHRSQVKRIGVFGSVARGEATVRSDIDFVVDYEYANTKDAMTEAQKWLDLEELMRAVFNPVELSVVNLVALDDNCDTAMKKDIERDVIWIYGS